VRTPSESAKINLMSRRFQFSLRWLFFATLVVAAFFGGIRFERERRHKDETAALAAKTPPAARPSPVSCDFAVNPNAVLIGPFMTPHELSRASGLTPKTLKYLVRDGMIPCPVKYDAAARPLFDLGDQKLAAWLAPLTGQAATQE
jgi:hypothetical protein